MKRKILAMVSAMLLAVTCLAACGAPADSADSSDASSASGDASATSGASAESEASSDSTGEASEEGEKIRIGISCCLMQNEFYAKMMSAYQELTETKYPNVEIVSILDGDLDLQKDIENIQTFVSQGVDLIIISLSDFNSTQEIIDLAQGIPIVFTNRLPTDMSLMDGENYTYVGSSEKEGGLMVGEYLAEKLVESGADEINYICFQGELGAQNAVDRTEGHIEALEATGLPMNEILNDVANWDRTEALQKTQQALGSGTDVNCIVANNDEMALGAIEALKAQGIDPSTVMVGGMDGVAAALESIKAGEMACSVLIDAETQAEIAMDAAVKIANGEKVEEVYWVPFELITADNVDEYMNQ